MAILEQAQNHDGEGEGGSPHGGAGDSTHGLPTAIEAMLLSDPASKNNMAGDESGAPPWGITLEVLQQHFSKHLKEVGPGGSCLPRHRLPFTSRHEGSKCAGCCGKQLFTWAVQVDPGFPALG